MPDPVLTAATMGLAYGGSAYGVTGYAIEAQYFVRGSGGGVVAAGASIVTPPPAGTARR